MKLFNDQKNKEQRMRKELGESFQEEVYGEKPDWEKIGMIAVIILAVGTLILLSL